MRINLRRITWAAVFALAVGAVALSSNAFGQSGGSGGAGAMRGDWQLDSNHNISMNLDGSGNGTVTLNAGGSVDNVAISGCVAVDANSASCVWSGTYSDSDKTITRHGTITLSANADTLTSICQVTGIDNENWHVPQYSGAGAESCATETWSRVGAGAPGVDNGGNPPPQPPPPPPQGPEPQPGPPQLQAKLICDPNPLVVTISELPSRPCTIWISNWRRNTAAPVQLLLPDALDGYGNHSNGIQVFGGNQMGSQQGVSVYDMGSYQSPDGQYGEAYPWNIMVFACPSQQGTGANCFNSVTSPGGFIVPMVVHQDGALDAAVPLLGTALAQPGSGGGQSAAFFRIHNYWQKGQFINIEPGNLESSPIQPTWWSAQWTIEPVPGTQYVRLNNRWKPGNYINIEHGLAISPIEDTWWSAMWMIEPVAGANGLYRIRNRWQPDQFLTVEHGLLQSAPIQDTWWSAMWSFEQ